MAPLLVTFRDIGGHFCCLKPFYLTCLAKYSMYYPQYAHTWIRKRTWLV